MTFFVDDMQNYDEKTCRNSSKCFHTQSEQYNMTMTFCKCQHTSGERLMWEVCASCKQRLMAITPYGDEGCVSRLRKKIQDLACVPFLCGNHDNEGTAMKKSPGHNANQISPLLKYYFCFLSWSFIWVKFYLSRGKKTIIQSITPYLKCRLAHNCHVDSHTHCFNRHPSDEEPVLKQKYEKIAVTLQRPSLAIHVTWSFLAANPVYFMAFIAFLAGAGAAAFLAAFIAFMAFMAFGMVKKEENELAKRLISHKLHEK